MIRTFSTRKIVNNRKLSKAILKLWNILQTKNMSMTNEDEVHPLHQYVSGTAVTKNHIEISRE